VQQVGVGRDAKWQVQTAKLTFGTQTAVQDALASNLHVAGGSNAVSTTFVGPSWGSQISQKALQALIAFMVVIVIYLSIAFEWKMAIAAFVALAHDIVITIGVYALTGFQVSPATVIGLLTILGYSLYDTVVVFDKVRENTAGLLSTGRTTYSQAANLALNQTLVRSINTSVIALLPVTAILIVAVFVLGTGELQDLALVLFVGMLSGTYSSICIATPVLADLKERESGYKQLARRVALRDSGGRAAQRARAKAARAGAAGAPADEEDSAEPGSDLDDGPEDEFDEATANGAVAGTGPDEPVPAGRAASGSAPRSAPGARSGPRQQPRRTSAAKRRPTGKKKRR
jgi:preprotein translocase subunit SecF